MTPEGKVKAAVIDALEKTGVHHVRIQSGKVRVRGGWMCLAKEGTADILCCPNSRLPVWLELKQLKGKQRECQIEFEASVRALGHSYHVIRGLDDLEPILRELT